MGLRRARELGAEGLSNGRPLIEDERFRERVAEIEVELKALEITQMRLIAETARQNGGKPDPKTSRPKMKGSQLQQETAELLLEVVGLGAMEFDPELVSGLRTEAAGDDWALAIAPNPSRARHVSIVGGYN